MTVQSRSSSISNSLKRSHILVPRTHFSKVHNLAKKERGQYPAILTEKAWSIKNLLTDSFWETFSCRRHREVLSKHFPKEEIHVESQHFSDHNEGEHILATRVGIDAINYTIQPKIGKQNFPTVTKSSLMNLC